MRAWLGFCLAKPVLTLVVINLLATLLVYVPLYENTDGYIHLAFSGLSLDNIYRYWDGPLYMVVAKTFYQAGAPELLAFTDLSPGYYAAHFPGYPATIRAFSYIFGYANGMIAATIAATSLSLWVLHQLLKDLGLSDKALWLGLVFIFLPPRWLIYHSVGAAEPLFLLEFFSFILFFRRKQYWLAGLAGAAAALTRSPGILLLGVYALLIICEYYRATSRPSVGYIVRRQDEAKELQKDLGLSDKALWLGLVFIFLPPRWLIYHSVGAAEPLFLLEFFSFILFFRRKQYWLAGLAGAAAALTRSPGILLLGVYALLIICEYYRATSRPSVGYIVRRQLLPMLPFAAAPLLLFGLYHMQYGDFFAYFHSGDNVHLTGAPFSSIWPSSVGYNWSEATLWIYLLNAVGILLLWRAGHYDLALFAAAFYIPLIFVAHHDLVRYMLPIFPLSLLIAYQRFIIGREFKLAMLLIVPAIYIYTWSGVQTNLAPADAMQQLLTLIG